jgi:cytochrome oxidase assembly protein ShyY1
LPVDRVTLEGLYGRAPGTGLRMGGNALPGQSSWPKLTIYIDTEEIGEDLGRSIDSGVLLLDADPESDFVREWTPQIIPPEKHLGYAFQWFCFALASLIIFIVLHWRHPKIETE